ncbi:putative aminoacyl-tRNA hydrolase [Helianthus anomalus]
MMDVTWLSAILVGAGCLAFGFFVGTRKPTKTLKTAALVVRGAKPPLEIEKLAEIIQDFKMVLVVRNDLKMGKGKIAAQCSHATLGLYKKILHRAPKALSRWEMCGQVKVVVKIESEDDMFELQKRAKSLSIPTHIVIDAGRTQIAPSKLPYSCLNMFFSSAFGRELCYTFCCCYR